MNKLTIGQQLTGTVSDLDYKGQGVIRYEGYVFFVPGVLSNELVIFQIIKLKKKYGEGKIIEIIEPSKNRVANDFSKYGACDLIHLDSFGQQIWQENLTKNTLEKAIQKSINCSPTITSDNFINYRNKSVFHVLKGEVLKFGLYNRAGNKLIPTTNFILSSKLTNDILKNISGANHKISRDNYKHLVIRTNEEEEAIVTLVVKKYYDNEIQIIAKRLLTDPRIKGFTININAEDIHILGKISFAVFGENRIVEVINGIKYNISDQSFFQVNTKVMSQVYTTIAKEVSGTKMVVDAYSGVGGIGFNIASFVENVKMIEINESSHEMALINMEVNNITNVELIHDRVENQKLLGDVIILDPPRSGLDSNITANLCANNYEKIIYLSCNLATLARDLITLLGNYDIKSVTPIRLFHQTTATETMMVLERKI